MATEAYCVKCRAKRVMKDEKQVTMKNGKPATQGVCPNCGTTIDVFRRGGGEALAREAGVPFLGAVPLDPALVQAGDEGRPYMAALATSPTAEAFRRAIEPLLALDDG